MNIEQHLQKHDSTLLGMARKVRNRYGLDESWVDDLFQEARMELMDVHDRYDHGNPKKAPLMTYAYWFYWKRLNKFAERESPGDAA
jgi:DNA-directed RNA polymerase specialized sigma subunit